MSARENPMVRRALKRLAEVFGAKAIKIHAGPYTEFGTPDTIACVPYTVRPEDVGRRIGLAVVMEGKRKGRDADAAQAVRLGEWAAAGAITGTFTSVAEAEAVVASRTGKPPL